MAWMLLFAARTGGAAPVLYYVLRLVLVELRLGLRKSLDMAFSIEYFDDDNRRQR